MRVLLTAQVLLNSFTFPVTHAYAQQVKSDVVVSVTYTQEIPRRVCTESFALDDPDMAQPLDTHCWTPTNPIGDVDTWKGERLDFVNFQVIVFYASGPVVIALTTRVNS